MSSPTNSRRGHLDTSDTNNRHVPFFYVAHNVEEPIKLKVLTNFWNANGSFGMHY